MKKINGNSLSRQLLKQLKVLIKSEQTKQLPQPYQHPRLGIILVGNHPASLSYIRKKRNFARKIGIKTRLFQLVDEDKRKIQEKLQKTIENLNKMSKYHSILVQLPLPQNLKSKQDYFLNRINPLKDVDCLSEINKLQMLEKGEKANILPCTPLGILKMLDSRKISVQKKNIVLIGKGKLVGDPLKILLSLRGGNVFACDVTNPIEEIQQKTKNADLIFSATGVPDLITEDHIKKGAVIIDIGVSKNIKNPKKKDEIRGDISEQTKQKMCSFYSPVPKGVGPMTVNSLMYNVYSLWKKQIDQMNT